MIFEGGGMKCLMCKLPEPGPGKTSVKLERGEFHMTVQDVPALICPHCGEIYTDEETVIRLFNLAREAEENGVEVDVRNFYD